MWVTDGAWNATMGVIQMGGLPSELGAGCDVVCEKGRGLAKPDKVRQSLTKSDKALGTDIGTRSVKCATIYIVLGVGKERYPLHI
jgi:hypothetical protein